MKKIDFKKVLLGILLIYTHWTCYDHFRSVSDHARSLMEWVETAGDKAGTVAAGMIKK